MRILNHQVELKVDFVPKRQSFLVPHDFVECRAVFVRPCLSFSIAAVDDIHLRLPDTIFKRQKTLLELFKRLRKYRRNYFHPLMQLFHKKSITSYRTDHGTVKILLHNRPDSTFSYSLLLTAALVKE